MPKYVVEAVVSRTRAEIVEAPNKYEAIKSAQMRMKGGVCGIEQVWVTKTTKIKKPKKTQDEKDHETLWNADPNCAKPEIYEPIGGGIKCRNCTGWFCY